jgi:hypothetical protein
MFFMSRHQEGSTCKAEGTATTRNMGKSRELAKYCFKLLSFITELHNVVEINLQINDTPAKTQRTPIT